MRSSIGTSDHSAACAVLITDDMGTGKVLAGVMLVDPHSVA